jgi:hypothetical protein
MVFSMTQKSKTGFPLDNGNNVLNHAVSGGVSQKNGLDAPQLVRKINRWSISSQKLF